MMTQTFNCSSFLLRIYVCIKVYIYIHRQIYKGYNNYMIQRRPVLLFRSSTRICAIEFQPPNPCISFDEVSVCVRVHWNTVHVHGLCSFPVTRLSTNLYHRRLRVLLRVMFCYHDNLITVLVINIIMLITTFSLHITAKR